MIKVNKSQKTLNLFELDWCGPINDGDNFLGVYVDAVDPDEKAQVEDFPDLEHTFLNVHIKSKFLQANQNQTNIFIMLFFIVTVD